MYRNIVAIGIDWNELDERYICVNVIANVSNIDINIDRYRIAQLINNTLKQFRRSEFGKCTLFGNRSPFCCFE